MMALGVGWGRAPEARLPDRALEPLLRAEFSTAPTSKAQALTTRIAGATPLV